MEKGDLAVHWAVCWGRQWRGVQIGCLAQKSAKRISLAHWKDIIMPAEYPIEIDLLRLLVLEKSG